MPGVRAALAEAVSASPAMRWWAADGGRGTADAAVVVTYARFAGRR
ncbi:hypothetical protein [Actinomadura bangladeshensis]|nr:hypothetical protein [Actinomadura bangladeshensis]